MVNLQCKEVSCPVNTLMLCRDNAIPLATSHIPSLGLDKKREALQAAVEHILTKGVLQLCVVTRAAVVPWDAAAAVVRSSTT